MSVLSTSAITRAKRVFEFNKRVIDEKGTLANLVPQVSDVFTVVDGKIVISVDDAELSKQNEISNVITEVMNDLLYFINVNELFLDDKEDYNLDISFLEILTILYSNAAERVSIETDRLGVKLPSLDYFLQKIRDFQIKDMDTQLRKKHKEMQEGALKDLEIKLERSKVKIKQEYETMRMQYEGRITDLEDQGKDLQQRLDQQQSQGLQLLEFNKQQVDKVLQEKEGLEKEISTLKSHNEELQSNEAKKAALEKRIRELQDKISKDQAVISNAEQERHDYEKGIDALQEEKSNLEQEKALTVEKLTAITKEKDRHLSHVLHEVDSLKEQVAALQELNETLKKDKEELQQPLKKTIEGDVRGDFQLIAIDLDNISKCMIERDKRNKREQRAIFNIEEFFKRLYDILHADNENVNLYKILGLIFYSPHNEKYRALMDQSKNTKLMAFASVFKWIPSRFQKIEDGIRRDQDIDTYMAAQTSTKIAMYRERIQNLYLGSGDKDMVPILDTIKEFNLDIPVKVITTKEGLGKEIREEILERAIVNPENKIYYI